MPDYFQVRINAVLPLSIPPERRYYGGVTLYCRIFATLIDALKGTEKVTEFSEFKYRDHLRQQVRFDYSYNSPYCLLYVSDNFSNENKLLIKQSVDIFLPSQHLYDKNCIDCKETFPHAQPW